MSMIQAHIADLPEKRTGIKHYNLVLLHGLFGSLSNWEHVRTEFSKEHTIHIPRLPLFDISLTETRLNSLVTFLKKDLDSHNLKKVVLIGNSLGGHVALLFSLKYPDMVEKLVLTGSSGLYENSFNGTFPRVKDYAYIQDRVKHTFYRKEVVTDALVDEVYQTVQSTAKVLSLISLARAAQRNNLSGVLHTVSCPVLLIWGNQDEITPPDAGFEFKQLLANAELKLIDQCGHVAMMEQPEEFNAHLRTFLQN